MLTWEEIMDILGAPSEIIECDDGDIMTFNVANDDYVEDDDNFPWDYEES